MEIENWDHLSVLELDGNGRLGAILSALAFSTSLDDISLINRVLHIHGKLLHQTLLAPVRQTKGEA